MKRCVSALLLAFLMLVPSIAMRSAAGTVQAADGPAAFILIEAGTGTVLEEHCSKTPLNAGFLSKLMSLLLIAEDIDEGKFTADTELTASENVRGTKGAVVWLEPGDRMTVDELLKSVVIGNANDAMTVLAEASEGSTENFVLRMNAEAFDLGLRDTSFYSPCGYDDAREHTTAADLAVICAELSKREMFAPYFSIWRDFVKNGSVELVSENYLAHTYGRHCGFKAAHSERSGYCIAEGARGEDGTCYIAVVLGAADDETARSAARKLCDKGFSGYKVTATMFPDEMMAPLKVKHGTESAVEIKIERQGELILPRDSGELRTVVVLPHYIDAPVRKGQKIGLAAFYNGKALVYEADIVTEKDVKKLTFGYVLSKMLLKMIE